MTTKKRKGMTVNLEETESTKTDISRAEIIAGARIKKAVVRKTPKIVKRIYLNISVVQKMKMVLSKKREFKYFTTLLEFILEEYLQNSKNFNINEEYIFEGVGKNYDVRLDLELIKKVQEVADGQFEGNFSKLTQKIIVRWLNKN
jgi:hypothetical protein